MSLFLLDDSLTNREARFELKRKRVGSVKNVALIAPILILLAACIQSTESNNAACRKDQVAFGGNCRFMKSLTLDSLFELQYASPKITRGYWCAGTECASTSPTLDETDTTKNFGLYFKPQEELQGFEVWVRSGSYLSRQTMAYDVENGFKVGDSTWNIRWRKNQLGAWYIDSSNTGSGSYFQIGVGETLTIYWF